MTRRRLWTTIAVALLATLVVSAAAMWVMLPTLARWAVVWQIEAKTGRRLTMREFDLDLRGGRLHITGFRLADREPGPPLAEFDRLDVRFRPAPLLRGHLWLEEVTLTAPRVRIVRTGRGLLNISDLLGRSKARGGAVAFTLDRLSLTGGAVVFEDRTLTPPRAWRAEPLTIEAALLSTVNPESRGSGRLTATVAGAPLSVELADVRLAPMQGRARVTLQDVDATLANLYLPQDTAVVLDQAVIGGGVAATIDAQGGVGLDGQARIDKLVIRRRGVDTALVTVPSLQFVLTSAKGPDGRALGHVEVAGRATVYDPRPGRSNRFELDRLKLVVDGLDTTGRSPARVSLAAALPGGGGLDVQGTGRAAPLGAELRTRISRVDLAFWEPYLDLPFDLTGMAETDLTVDVASAGSLTTRIRGRATIVDATVRDQTRRLAAADRLELTGLDAQWPKARIARIQLNRPRARIERDPEGRLSVVTLVESMKAAPPDAAPAVKPAAKPSDLTLEIGEVVVDDGRLRLDDAIVSPPARLRVAPVRLTARDVTWPSRRPIQVQFTSATPEAGTVEAEGSVTLDPVRFDLRARVTAVALAPYRPYVPLRARLEGRLDGDLAMKGTLGPRTEFSARGSAGLSDLAFTDGDRPILTVGRLAATGLDYTWPATAVLDRVHMQKSWVMVERRADGSLPLREIFTAARRSPTAQPEPRPGSPAPAPTPTAVSVTVRESVFEEGAATIVDAAVSPTARIDVVGVRLVARDFVWPARAAIPVRLEMPTPGAGSLTASGQLDVASRSLTLQVTPNGVDLAPAQPYLPLRGRIAGKASGDVQVKATLDPLVITARGTATLADLAVADGDRPPLATAARLETTGIEYAWPATVAIESVRLLTPWAQVERAADGSFPLIALLKPTVGPAAPPSQREPAAGSVGRPAGQPAPNVPPRNLDIRVRRATIEGGVVAIVDSAVSPAARIQLQGASFEAQNLTWPARGPAEIRLRTQTASGGSVDARGQLRFDTQAVDVQAAVKQLDLATMQAFLPSRGTLEGKMDGDVRVRGTLSPLAVAATGRLAFDDPTFGDGQRMLAYIKRVDVTGLDADWPRRVTIERLAIEKPWSLLERDADGSVPLLALIMSGGPAASPATPPAAPRPGRPSTGGPATTDSPAPVPIVRVGTVTVEEGFVRFVDRTTTPAFTEEASRITLTGRGLGSGRDSRGQLTMAGRLTGGAPFELRGQVGAIGGPLNFDLEGKLTDFPLPRVNPYSNNLIGWIARRGAFGATVRYKVTDNEVEATNDVLIGQPEYVPSRSGDAVRERVGVPFGLLISLLKNARGEIRLSVPVSGNLASRQFDMSDAFWEAVRKTAIGVMALPVSWVGKIFYTEDARVETVQIWPVYFEAGTTRFTRGFDEHAARLAIFLRDAPGVALALKPILTVDDIAALKRDVVRRRIDGATREAGQTGAEAVAARLFAERFPGQPAPAGLDALVAELAKVEPNPEAAAKALVAQRMETTRSRLLAPGNVTPDRLRVADGVVPVEGSGPGRIEFEIAP